MFATTVSTARDAVLSAAGAVFLSLVLVGAAVVPVQTATAAVLGL